MSSRDYKVSARLWESALRSAMAGEPRRLLGMLLDPVELDAQGNPVPGAVVPLPDDLDLRLRIVRTLVFGPWRKAEGVTTVADLMTHEFGGKPRLSELEVAAAALVADLTGDPKVLVELADAHGVDISTLRRRIAKQRRARKA
jgi:hypothetical protein